MTHNDTLQLILSTFDLDDSTVIKIFSLADFNTTQQQINAWGKKEDDETFIQLKDSELAMFLNGFINFKRGKREGAQPKPEAYLNNNMIFQKLRIALNLKSEDILNILEYADINLSKHELSAFFRKPENKHYKDCTDKTLQGFLFGVQCQL